MLVYKVSSGEKTRVFKVLYGAKGDKGDTGLPAGFGTPIGSIETLPSNASPTIHITATGENISKVFSFDFGIPINDITTVIDDNLTSTSTDKALSSNQGRILNTTKANIADLAEVATSGNYNDLLNKPIIPSVDNSLTSTAIDKALSANQGRILDETKANKTDISTVGSTGSYNDLLNKPVILSIDNSLSDISENPVQNKVITLALNNKQDTLVFDDTPTNNSSNVVISSGIKSYVDIVQSNIDAHISNVSNPHSVTKSQIGLDNVENTTDLNKPISTATQTALNLKADISSIPTNVSDLINNTGFITSAGSSIQITLLANNWSNNTITVTATGVTSSNSIMISPVAGSTTSWISSVIYCSEQSTDSLTFTCSNTPTEDLIVNIMIFA